MKYGKIALLITAALFTLTLTSCQMLMDLLFGDTVTVTIAERIAAFEESLNVQDQPNILDHIHPDMRNSDQLKDPLVIGVSPLDYSNHDFIIGEPDINQETNVATCTFENGNGATGVIEFAMKLDDTEYKILRFTLTITGASGPALEIYQFFRR